MPLSAAALRCSESLLRTHAAPDAARDWGTRAPGFRRIIKRNNGYSDDLAAGAAEAVVQERYDRNYFPLCRAAFCGIDVLRSRRSSALHSAHVDDG